MTDREILRLPDVLGILDQWAGEGWAGGIHTSAILADKLQDHDYSHKQTLDRLRSLAIFEGQHIDLEEIKNAQARMPAALDDWDWREVFKHAGKPDPCPPDSKVSTATFDRADVLTVIAAEYGQPDGDDWVCFGRLKDLRFFVVRAGTCYTGWGCQESGSADVGETHDDVLWHGLTDSERQRLNLALPTEGK